MVKKLTFDEALRPAFQQIFGRSIICPNLEIASAYVRSHGVNAVTLDGDKVERKGALTGGYQDPRRSRLDAVNDVRKWKTQSEQDTAKQNEIKRRLTEIEQEITSLMGEMYTLQHRRDEARNSRGPLTEELQWARTEADDLAQRLQSIERREADQSLELKAAQTKRAGLEEELRTPMSQGLTPQEAAQLETLNAQEDQQKRELADKTNTLSISATVARCWRSICSKTCVDVKKRSVRSLKRLASRWVVMIPPLLRAKMFRHANVRSMPFAAVSPTARNASKPSKRSSTVSPNRFKTRWPSTIRRKQTKRKTHAALHVNRRMSSDISQSVLAYWSNVIDATKTFAIWESCPKKLSRSTTTPTPTGCLRTCTRSTKA